MTNLSKCLKAAEEVTLDRSVVRKSGYPTVPEFDAALEELADYLKRDDERYYQAYTRAFDSPEGQLLYAAREWAINPEPVWKREPERISKAEAAIELAITKYCKDHPDCNRDRGLLRVLESQPELYQAYEREKAAEDFGT